MGLVPLEEDTQESLLALSLSSYHVSIQKAALCKQEESALQKPTMILDF